MTQEEGLRFDQEVFLQDAYQKGREIKRIHVQQQCARQDDRPLIAAADFAHLCLHKEMYCAEIHNPHARASLRMRAFLHGYLNEMPVSIEGNPVPKFHAKNYQVQHKRTRRHPRSKRQKDD